MPSLFILGATAVVSLILVSLIGSGSSSEKQQQRFEARRQTTGRAPAPTRGSVAPAPAAQAPAVQAPAVQAPAAAPSPADGRAVA